MKEYSEGDLREFVAEKVDDFLKIRRKGHSGYLLFGLNDHKLLGDLEKMFKDEFENRREEVIVEVSYNGADDFPRFSAGTWSVKEDSPGYYPIDLGFYLEK